MFSCLLWQVEGGAGMNKNNTIVHYCMATLVFRKWLETGILSKEEFTEIEAQIANKYCLSKNSIYR